MNLENITLHVEESKIIDSAYIHYYLIEIKEVYFVRAESKISVESGDVVIAECGDNQSARNFCNECNEQLKAKLAKGLTPWNFVERYYPNYSSCGEIAYLNDLWVIQEITDVPTLNSRLAEIFKFDCNCYRDEVYALIEKQKATIYEKAIQAFILEHPNLIRL